MSREILFRAKRIDNDEWIQGDLLRDFTTTWIFPGYGASGREVKSSTVCQYTGLTDRNGVKIWEGDIVKWFNDIPMRTMYAQIAYADGAFVREYEGKVGTARLFINERSAKELEVIGNILDNPELLEGGTDHE